MENTLKETEWLTINKVLLEMYDITDIDQFTERVLKTYRMLIPYTKGYFIVTEPSPASIKAALKAKNRPLLRWSRESMKNIWILIMKKTT